VIDLLVARGFIAARDTSRAGKRPERTTYELTGPGYDELRAWMHALLRTPVNEYPQFTAGLSLLPVLPPEEAVALLRERAIHLAGEAARLESHLAELAHQEVPLPPHEIPPALVGRKFPPLFLVEAEYKVALIRAELAFVTELVRRITEENWGPVDLWRDLQAASARQHEAEANSPAREAPM
jgi:DNA-binding PadR family transcriptional regulator